MPALQTVVFAVEKMHCGSCAARVEKVVLSIPQVVTATVNLATHQLFVCGGDPQDIQTALRAAGYPAKAASHRPDNVAVDTADLTLRRDLIIAALFTFPVFVVAMGGHLIPPFGVWLVGKFGVVSLGLFQFVFVSLVLFGPGLRFFRTGFPALLRAAPDMNSLVALGAGAAWAFSTLVVFAPDMLPGHSQDVYFEAAAVIVTLILLGRFLEARAKGRTGAAIEKLVQLQPQTATKLEREQPQIVPIASLRPGDLLQLKPGERVAVDGELITGTTYIDESMMTGEATPVAKSTGASLYAGTVNGRTAVTYRATKTGSDMMLAQIIDMVTQAQGARLPVQNVVNQITLWFVPAILVVAVTTFVAWVVWGPSFGHALVACVSVLIIACPCAMGLAVPTSIMVGMGRAAEMGVFFRKGGALQTLSQAEAVAFDKTGTLTMGAPSVTAIHRFGAATETQVLRFAAALEQQSEHALAASVLVHVAQAHIDVPDASDVTAVAGMGLKGKVEGIPVLVGSRALLTRHGVDVPTAPVSGTEINVAVDQKLIGLIIVADPLRPEAAEVTRHLQAAGLKTAMITGDNAQAAAQVARQLPALKVVADVLPDGKAAALGALARKTVFVGDGINDAPALAAAHVGIAVGTGTDVAIESADVVLISDDLRGVVNAFWISRATMRNIRQNLTWAFGYNVLLIPVAAGVFYPSVGVLLSPMLAAGAMALSSVFVVANALRLRKVKTHPSVMPAVSATTVG